MEHIKHKKMTQEDKDKIFEMRKQGVPVEEISKQMGYCYNAVSNYLGLLQYQGILPMSKSNMTSVSVIEEILRLWDEGKTRSQIARELGIIWNTVNRYIKYGKEALPMLKEREERIKKSRENRVYHVNNPKKPGRKPITQEDKEKILFLRNSQMTVDEVSDASGFCRSIVIRVCREWREKGFDVYSKRNKKE